MLESNYSDFVIAIISYDEVSHEIREHFRPQNLRAYVRIIVHNFANHFDISTPKPAISPLQMSHPTYPVILPHLTRLLSKRAFPKTICPSEVARALSPAELTACDVTSWRDLMDDVRVLVWDMRNRGEVEVLQGGVVFEGKRGEVRGPIRVRLKREDGEAEV